MTNYYYNQALAIGTQLDRENYAKGLGTGQYPMSGVDLRHIGASNHATLEDVPLNRKVSTLYAIETIAPDGARAIYEGNHGQSLTLWLGAKVLLNNSGDVGVVVGIKDMWSGDIKRMTSSPDPEGIRAARKASGLTQEQAGELIGATRRTWQEWEAGRRNMPAAKWELFQIKTKEKKMQTYTVLLIGGTVGDVRRSCPPEVGDHVTVSLHDENGLPVKANGVVEDVLEEREY